MSGEPTDLQAENEALKRRLAEAEAALAAAGEAQVREARRNALLTRANDLLDQQLFRSTISHELVKAAEASEDLERFSDELFDLVRRLVRVKKAGLRFQRQSFVAFHLRPEGDPALFQALEAIAGGREPTGFDPGMAFTCHLGRAEAPFGHVICLAEGSPFTPHDRELLSAICRQASPILENHLLIRLLQELAGFRDDFVTMLSHDLRNPLTGVMSSLSTLLVPGLPLNEDEREGLVRTALDSARLVNEMIGDLLDVAKLEAGRMTIEAEPVDLEALVDRAVQTMQPVARVRRLEVAIDIPPALPPVRGDESKLLRVLINLLSNALKYTQRGGVLIRLAAEPERVVVTVADTGFGVPVEAQGQIFEKFYQVANRQRAKVSGSGLGLAFCRQMIEAHGGKIEVESPSSLAAASGLLPALPEGREAPGAAFIFSLPRYQSPDGRGTDQPLPGAR